MELIIGPPVTTNWKSKTYDSILVIINRLMEMVYYKPVKVTIDALALIKIISKMMI